MDKYGIMWVTTDLREEEPIHGRQRFPRTLHCVDKMKYDKFYERKKLYVGEWTYTSIISGSALCGIKWEKQEVANLNSPVDSFNLCQDCVNVLLDVDSMSSEQLWSYYEELLIEGWNEQGRWLYAEESKIMEVMEEKIKKCLAEVMDKK